MRIYASEYPVNMFRSIDMEEYLCSLSEGDVFFVLEKGKEDGQFFDKPLIINFSKGGQVGRCIEFTRPAGAGEILKDRSKKIKLPWYKRVKRALIS